MKKKKFQKSYYGGTKRSSCENPCKCIVTIPNHITLLYVFLKDSFIIFLQNLQMKMLPIKLFLILKYTLPLYHSCPIFQPVQIPAATHAQKPEPTPAETQI